MALCPKFENVLEEGMVVFLSKFGVGENRGKYPLLKHRYKLNFYRCTSVKTCFRFDGPRYGFNFFDFAEINNYLHDPNLPVGMFFFGLIPLMIMLRFSSAKPYTYHFSHLPISQKMDSLPAASKTHSKNMDSQADSTTFEPPVKDKGDCIMDVLNLVVKFRGYELRMKNLLEEMLQDVGDARLEKIAARDYVRGYHGTDADLCWAFVLKDLHRDELHKVKINNALAVVEDSIDLKAELIENFSKL